MANLHTCTGLVGSARQIMEHIYLSIYLSINACLVLMWCIVCMSSQTCPVWAEPPKWIPDDLCRLVLIDLTRLSIHLDYLINNYSPQAPWIVGNRGIKDKRYIPCHLSLVLSISLFMWRFQKLFWFCLKHVTRDWLVRLAAWSANENDSRLNTNVLDV